MLAQQWKPVLLSPKQLNEIVENTQVQLDMLLLLLIMVNWKQKVEEEAVPEVSTGLRDKLQAALTAEYGSPKSLSPSPPPTPPPPAPTVRNLYANIYMYSTIKLQEGDVIMNVFMSPIVTQGTHDLHFFN